MKTYYFNDINRDKKKNSNTKNSTTKRSPNQESIRRAPVREPHSGEERNYTSNKPSINFI